MQSAVLMALRMARQYTIPVESALEAVRSGKNPELTTREKHTRECFVVAEEGADLARDRRMRSRPCRITLMSMIPLYTLFLRKN